MAKPLDFLHKNNNEDEWAKRYVANVQNEVSTLGENEIINDENKSDNNKEKDLNDTK